MAETTAEKLARLNRRRRVELKVSELATLFTLSEGGAVTLNTANCLDEIEGLHSPGKSPGKIFAVVMNRGPEGVIAIFENDPDEGPGVGLAQAAQRASSAMQSPETPATSQGAAARAAGGAPTPPPLPVPTPEPVGIPHRAATQADAAAEPATNPAVPHPSSPAAEPSTKP